jgi:ubiquinone/menaquinone biosynthesis C-methylase UbiE
MRMRDQPARESRQLLGGIDQGDQSSPWDDPSYGDLGGDFDRLFDDVDVLSRLEATSLNELFRGRGIRTILDCACGSGIQAIGLALLGYRVEVSDVAPEMLDVVTTKARRLDLAIPVHNQDFRRLDLGSDRFDAVICCGGSLTLVPVPEDIERTLGSMLRATRPGGLIVVGLHNYQLLAYRAEEFLLRRPFTRMRGDVAFDARIFEARRARVFHTIMSMGEDGWSIQTSAKSHHYLSGSSLRRSMLAVGCVSVELRDITGVRQIEEEEWVLAVGQKAAA